ncbi:MAG: class I SAM-dependent methyltransferase [Dehalococcoidia bacterium]
MNTYDEIAESWYRLRHWTRFKMELEGMARRWRGGSLLNIGCAHGPDFLPFTDKFDLWGLDSSENMINMALKYSAKYKFHTGLIVGDAASLPFKDGAFDWAISVAAYHHISDKGERKAAFAELRRVIKPKGEVFITVWNRWQKAFWNKGRQAIVPWKTKDGEIPRYYYLYTYPEIEQQVRSAGFKVLKTFPEKAYRLPFKFFSRNICVLAGAD